LLDESSLKDWLSRDSLSRIQKSLLILACQRDKPMRVSEIREKARDSGLQEANNWNFSDILKHSEGNAIRIKDGWALTLSGKRNVRALLGTPLPPVASSLRTSLASIKNAETQAFLSEAIECYERKLLRAAVVLSWVGALSLLYSEIVENHLSDFNSEAIRRDPKWRSAKNEDDLARMKKHNFLDAIEALSIIGKSVKDELQSCLKLRNGCGHPNTLKISENRVASHVETLLLNVFTRFSS
jgi:hypothetical protein